MNKGWSAYVLGLVFVLSIVSFLLGRYQDFSSIEVAYEAFRDIEANEVSKVVFYQLGATKTVLLDSSGDEVKSLILSTGAFINRKFERSYPGNCFIYLYRDKAEPIVLEMSVNEDERTVGGYLVLSKNGVPDVIRNGDSRFYFVSIGQEFYNFLTKEGVVDKLKSLSREQKGNACRTNSNI